MTREVEWLIGDLLVAEPTLRDPHFARTVVLVLDHDDNGAIGVVLTRPSEHYVDAALPGWGEHVDRPARIFGGGPVSPETAMAVGVLKPDVDASSVDGFAPAGLITCLVDLDNDPAEARELLQGLRIFSGYSGWAAGQVENEISEGAWLIVPAEPDDLSCPDPELLWERVLRRQGGWLSIAADFPLDPSAN